MYEEKRFISTPISNNRLNFLERTNPSIIVPSLIEGTLDDVVTGSETAIECDVDGTITTGKGLKNFIFLKDARVPTWIMDNHNHAFAFWHEALAKCFIREGSLLVHIDQHTDLSTPVVMPDQVQNAKSIHPLAVAKPLWRSTVEIGQNIEQNYGEREKQNDGLFRRSIKSPFDSPFLKGALSEFFINPPFGTLNSELGTPAEIEEYTNSVLTIADFIVPALSIGLISEALMVTGEERDGVGIFTWEIQSTKDKGQNGGLLKKIPHIAPLGKGESDGKEQEDWMMMGRSIVVDIDLDYFSQGFDELKCFETVRYWIEKADIITIATSPLFIDQEKALTVLKSLQNNLMVL